MTTLRQIHDDMYRYNQSVAYGSECNAWGDFVNDSFQELKMAPWDDKALDTEPGADFAAYWLTAAKGENDDYDAETGNKVEDA